MTPYDDLRAALHDAVAEVAGSLDDVEATLERPRQAGFGDYSTNAALLLAPRLKAPPRDIAGRLGGALRAKLGAAVERVDVAGPGFVNLVLADSWYVHAAARVHAAGASWGGGGAAPAERILVEFVSVNPTGPLHVGHARNAAYGDALARLLSFRGHAVEREYYVNDFGSQVRNFGASIRARARGDDVPEGGYRGAYVADIARAIPEAAGMDVDELARRGVELMLERAAATLARFGVTFDHWFSERTLHTGTPSLVQHAYDVLAAQGRTYRSEGALWLRTTAFGDDKDRVLERSSGEHTYFASDIAYHQHKRERGYDRLIDVWGADHHGYVRRMHAAFEALGGEPDRMELVIMQFVHLVERGERASMSKRAGEFVLLDDLIDEIGTDAARWYLLQRSHDTTIDLDLALAREQTSDNPVFYVQYAHARIASVLRRAGERGGALPAAPAPSSLHPAERDLIKKLLAFPAEVEEAAARRAPHRIAVYALEVAQEFTAFYRDCRVVGAEGEGVEAFRAQLCVSTKRTVARALELLGVSAPEEMSRLEDASDVAEEVQAE